MNNLFAGIPASLPEELVETLLPATLNPATVLPGTVRIERIVSQGHQSPPSFWFDQERPEWVLLVRGAARLRFENETIDMQPGDFINIPAHQPHRVEWTTPDEPTIWLAVHYD
jgi:cupin 2 domain-containing protein